MLFTKVPLLKKIMIVIVIMLFSKSKWVCGKEWTTETAMREHLIKLAIT